MWKLLPKLKNYFGLAWIWRRPPVTLWVAAATHYNRAEYRKAAEYYSRGLRQNPTHRAAHSARLDLAYCLFKDGQILESIDCLAQALKAKPSCHETHTRLAHLLQWIGRDDEVLELITEQTPLSRLVLGQICLSALNAQHPLAKHYLALARRQPLEKGERGSHLIRIASAREFAQSGNKHQARKLLFELASAEQASPEALIAFSEFLLASGKVAFARQQLRRALSLVPNHPAALMLSAETYLIEGAGLDPQAAVALAIRACQSGQWSDPKALFTLSRAYLADSDGNAAALAVAKAEDLQARYGINKRSLVAVERGSRLRQ